MEAAETFRGGQNRKRGNDKEFNCYVGENRF